MKGELSKIIKKYEISRSRIAVVSIIATVVLLRFFMNHEFLIKPLGYLADWYINLLIGGAQVFLSLFSDVIIFDYSANQIINSENVLNINSMFYSLNQILAVLFIILLTPSPFRSKIIYFSIAFAGILLYNFVRITIHSMVPNTFNTHNWLFNIVLIPRWLIVIGVIYIYWKRFPALKELIKKRFNFSEEYILRTFRNLCLLTVLYFLIVIVSFNDYFFISGDNFISLVLNTSKEVLEILGYESSIDYKTISGPRAILYMDDACLGIDLMFLFSAFIIVLPGPTKHKLWYIFSGLIVIVILNCVRVVLIFVNITENIEYTIPLDIHDLFTYPVLVFTLFLWIMWINKFMPKKVNQPRRNL